MAAGCDLGAACALAAGSVLPKGTNVPAGQLWAGSPAKYVRALTPEESAGHAQMLQARAREERGGGMDALAACPCPHASSLRGR